MSLPLRSYFFSPLNAKIDDKLRNHDQLLNVHSVEVQPTRRSDILTTFRVALYDQSRSSLLLFAESLRSNTGQFPLNYETDMKINKLSTLHTISFTNPRLDPSRDGDFCIYFTLETSGAETFVTDLALFIRTLGRKLIRWSVLGCPDRLDAGDPAHPMLQDLAYCWDGVACVHGVLQFCASPVSVMNIRRTFHRTSRICGPFCHAHRYEYLASGIFLDVERGAIPPMFADMEVAAQELCDNHALFVNVTNQTNRLPH